MAIEALPSSQILEENESAGTYGLGSLLDDIQETRKEIGWESLATVSPQRREPLLRRYVEAIDEARRDTLELATRDGSPASVLHRVNSIYWSDLALTWHTYAPDSVRRHPLDIRRKLVEWQHAAQRYLLVCHEDEAQQFWRAYESLDPEVQGTRTGTRGPLRAGILGPVATALALRSRLGWEAAPPEDPADDEYHAVDLVARTTDGKTILFQIETVGAHGAFEWERVPNDDRIKPRYGKTQDLRVGMRSYVEKYGLDPAQVEGIYFRVPFRSIDWQTGMPDGATSGNICEAVRSTPGRS